MTFPTRPRALKHPERHEQKAIVGLLSSLGGRVWVLGTTRKKGDHQGTMQTPGMVDCIAFLKRPGDSAREPFAPARVLLMIECKAKGGRLRPEQAMFREMCLEAEVHHVVGGVDAVIAWLVQYGFIKADSVPHYRIPKNLQESR
jgi:hypothetical protein